VGKTIKGEKIMSRKFLYYSILDTEILILKMHQIASKIFYSAAGFFIGVSFLSLIDWLAGWDKDWIAVQFDKSIFVITLIFATTFIYAGYREQKRADKLFNNIESESRAVE